MHVTDLIIYYFILRERERLRRAFHRPYPNDYQNQFMKRRAKAATVQHLLYLDRPRQRLDVVRCVTTIIVMRHSVRCVTILNTLVHICSCVYVCVYVSSIYMHTSNVYADMTDNSRRRVSIWKARWVRRQVRKPDLGASDQWIPLLQRAWEHAGAPWLHCWRGRCAAATEEWLGSNGAAQRADEAVAWHIKHLCKSVYTCRLLAFISSLIVNLKCTWQR